MADTKITALTALTAADPANDVIPIVDVSDTTMAASGTTKKISVNNILGASGTATLASATITGDLTVDTTTLKVDATNNRVGIGTATPATDLHVFKSSATDNALIQLQNGTASSYIGTRGTTYGAVDAGDTYIFNSSGNDIVLMADNAAGTIKFAAGGNAESMRLNSTGNLVLKGGTAAANGVGVTFPATQVASSDANCLDDYEEGTFTPTVIGGTIAGTATYSAQVGSYTKVGRVVQFSIDIAYTGGSGTGSLRVDGLPFQNSNNLVPVSTYPINIALTALYYAVGLVGTNGTKVDINQLSTGGGSDLSVPYDAAGRIILSGTYTV